MEISNFKLNTATLLGILFFICIFGLIFSKDYIFDLMLSGSTELQDSQTASKATADLLLSVSQISLDTSILNTPYLQSLTPLPSFPIDAQTLANFGKKNPFIGNFIVVPTKATTSIGAVIYSDQRSANNGQSIRAVNPNVRQTR